jgi:hypothetical protein
MSGLAGVSRDITTGLPLSIPRSGGGRNVAHTFGFEMAASYGANRTPPRVADVARL